MTIPNSAYTDITLQIIEALEEGRQPWNPEWTESAAPLSLPRRWTGESYQGINVLMLWLAAAERGFTSSRWFTYRQARKVGGQVRRGERSTRVVYFETRTRLNEEEEEIHHRILKRYAVFNADQIDNLPPELKSDDSSGVPAGNRGDIDRMIAQTGANITERQGESDAYYLVSADRVVVPHRDSFDPVEQFYGVLMHELVHWTGNRNRLGRLSRDDTDKDYAFEELVAEIGACFVCSSLGIAPDLRNSAAYIKNWAIRLRADHRMIFRAAGAAQKAADYLLARMKSACRAECRGRHRPTATTMIMNSIGQLETAAKPGREQPVVISRWLQPRLSASVGRIPGPSSGVSPRRSWQASIFHPDGHEMPAGIRSVAARR